MRAMVLTIGADLTLTGALPFTGVGQAGTYTLTARGGTAPYTITVQSEDLPAEWTITPNSDGTVDIETTEAVEPGEYTVVFVLKDAERRERLITRHIRVIALPLEITGTLSDFAAGTPYMDTLTIIGGAPPYLVIYLAGLPDGITHSLLGDTITFSGTPTGVGFPPGYSFTVDIFVQVEDSLSAAATFSQSVGLTITTLTLPGDYDDGTEGVPYSDTLTAAGGAGDKVYTLQSGTLPAGLSLDSDTGELYGTPTTATGYSFVIRATDENGNPADSSTQNVTIAAAGPTDPYFAYRVSVINGQDNTPGSGVIVDAVAGRSWTLFGGVNWVTSGSDVVLRAVPNGTNRGAKEAGGSAWDLGSGPWVIEWWGRYNGAPEAYGRYFQTVDGDFAAALGIFNDAAAGPAYRYLAFGLTTGNFAETAFGQWSSNMDHFLMKRSATGGLYVFLNGVNIYANASYFGAAHTFNSSDKPILLGQSVGTARTANYDMRNFRMTIGSEAGIPNSGSFTPDTYFPTS